jgi:NADH-quinone oxidoreductase subunit J
VIVAADAANVLVWIVWFFAVLACIGSGIAVVSFSNPFYSALALIGNLGSLAVLYLLLSAEFVAAAQVLVYAGAVMVMFLFVIAYLGGHADAPWAGGPRWQTIGAVGAALALFGEIVAVIGIDAGGHFSTEGEITRAFGSPAEIGRLFLTDHLLAFEITSIVLLVAAVGGVILGAHSRLADQEETSLVTRTLAGTTRRSDARERIS